MLKRRGKTLKNQAELSWETGPLLSPGDATISVYNTRGQLVDVIQKGYMSAGYHTAAWTPDNLPSGVYFVELRAGGQRDVMKVGYVK